MASFWRNLDTKTRITLSTLGLLLFCLLFRELIPRNDGLGSDGVGFARWVRDLSLDLPTRVNDYSIRRMLPPTVVHGVLRLLGLPFTNANIIWAFTWINIALTTLAVNLWCRSAKLLEVSDRGQWLGFLLLACSYATLKWSLYYPVLSDCWALALGSGILLAWLRGRTAVLLVLVTLSSVVWPSMIYVSVPLIAFPRSPVEEDAPAPWRLNRVAAAIGGVLVLVASTWVFQSGFHFKQIDIQAMTAVLPLSMTIQALYVASALWLLLDSRSLWMDLHPRAWITRWHPWVAIGLPLLLLWLGKEISARPSPVGERFYFNSIFYAGLVQPGVFLLAHVLFFGPLLLLVPLVLRRLGAGIRVEGTGIALFFVLACFLSLDSESRHHLNWLPFLALFLARAIDGLHWTPRRLWTMAAISLLFSKVWLRMNVEQDLPYFGKVDYQFYYYASNGPWMEHSMYFIQLLVVAFVFALLYSWFGRRSHTAE